jgi:putative tricarboxylic transport membrane protein
MSVGSASAGRAALKLGWQIGSVCFFALFSFGLALALQLPMGDALGPGPGFFPLWLGLVGATLAIILFVQVRRQPADGPGDERLAPDRPAVRRILAVLILLAAVALLLDPLGFRLTALLFTALLLPGLGVRSPIIIAIFAATAGFGVFHVFYYWLKVPLPLGVFGI